MQQWEYCEVGWTPKQVTIHVYSSRADGTYEGVQTPEQWGALLSQLGTDGWELVGVVPTRPANYSLYYFKRPISTPASSERKRTWEELSPEERMVKMKEEIAKRKKQLAEQKKP